VPSEPGLPLVVSSGAMSDALADYLGEEYVIEYYGLRPEVLLCLAIRSDLWQEFLKTRAR